MNMDKRLLEIVIENYCIPLPKQAKNVSIAKICNFWRANYDLKGSPNGTLLNFSDSFSAPVSRVLGVECSRKKFLVDRVKRELGLEEFSVCDSRGGRYYVESISVDDLNLDLENCFEKQSIFEINKPFEGGMWNLKELNLPDGAQNIEAGIVPFPSKGAFTSCISFSMPGNSNIYRIHLEPQKFSLGNQSFDYKK